VSTLQVIADIAPEPTLGGAEISLIVVGCVVLFVVVAVLAWRARRQESKPRVRAEPGFISTPLASAEPSPSSPSSRPSTPQPEAAVADAPPFDRQKALDLCGEDEELLYTVIQEMTPEIDSQMQLLRDALAAEDVATVHVTSHRLKGSLMLIAAEASAAVALKIELAGREENLADIPEKMAELDAELVRLKAAIAEYLQAAAA
jgi:HPt (histidine-containing phosphotransfer) domain-containing protein